MAKAMNALIYPDAPTVIADRRMIDVDLVPNHKKMWWRPVIVVGDDAFNPLTHKKTGPVTTIEETQVVDTYSVVCLTTQELTDQKSAAVESVNGSFKPILKILLDHENRIRDRQNPPQSPLTMAQFKAPWKELL
jgi:hypothetical protein